MNRRLPIGVRGLTNDGSQSPAPRIAVSCGVGRRVLFCGSHGPARDIASSTEVERGSRRCGRHSPPIDRSGARSLTMGSPDPPSGRMGTAAGESERLSAIDERFIGAPRGCGPRRPPMNCDDDEARAASHEAAGDYGDSVAACKVRSRWGPRGDGASRPGAQVRPGSRQGAAWARGGHARRRSTGIGAIEEVMRRGRVGLGRARRRG